MKERAATFGRGSNLIGITSEPEVPSRTRPHVIVLNSGLLHKVGPFRLSVDLARRLASDGFCVLRFDLSGIGDSKMRLAGTEKDDRPVSDVTEAMDHLAATSGASRFVLMGLCSGSDNSHRAAVADSRVVGAVHLDGYGFRTPGWYARYYGARLTSPSYLRRKLARRSADEAAAIAAPDGSPINARTRIFPPIDQVAREFDTLMRRDVRLLYIYTRGVYKYALYRDQLREAFPKVDFGTRLELEHYPLAEHTYPLVRSRERVLDRIVGWMNREFGQSSSFAGTAPMAER